MNELIETRQATIEQVAPNLLEVRYKPGQTIDPKGLSEVLAERERLCNGAASQAVLAIFPNDLDFEMTVMTSDHYKARPVVECTHLLAIATNGMMHERMASLYFAYFPQPFRTAVFTDEKEARAWLLARMSEPALN